MAVSHTLVRGAGGGCDSLVDLNAISDLLPDARNVLWLDIKDPTEGDLELLSREFGFHELALEDVAKRHQRAKVDQYGEYYFVIFYAVAVGRLAELNLFIGKNYLVTIHSGEVPEVSESIERWRRNADRIEHGVGALVYSLLDAVVDGYFPVVDDVAERVERVEADIFTSRADCLQAVFGLKKELLNLRRTLAPERDVLNVLLRRDAPIFSQDVAIYFQDVYDHTIRVLESIDLYRDQLSSMLDAYLSVAANRLNVVMKRMTALATILVSMTVISGIYGMNFDFMPELKWQYGYFYALGLITAIGIGLAIMFKRIDWL